MKFPSPLIECVLLKRYKRFLADIRLPSGETVVAHVPNSGSMIGVSDPNSLCLVSRSENPLRKLAYTLEMVRTLDGVWVGTNTSLTNKLIEEAFELGTFADWQIFSRLQREVKISAETRLDF